VHKIALTGLSAVFLFEMLDNSILTVALPTIGRDLHASTAALQLVTSSYAIAFGLLMLPLSALADRVGRRRIMLVGLAILALASLATAVVTTVEQLVVFRIAMGVAAAMTTPGSLSLAFRMFDADELRIKATTLISTVGLVGLAVGPPVGGFVLAFAPWQVLLLVNVPIAVLAFVCIRVAIAADDPAELYRGPVKPFEALKLAGSVSSGLAFKGAAGLATAGLGYLATLQLQLAWGWTPAQAALGMLPQVAVLIAGGALIGPVVKRLGLDRAAWMSSAAVVAGLAVYSVLGRFGYGWVALSLVLVAAGLRVVGVVAGTSVLKGVPSDRTTVGAALVDTASELASAIGIAIAGTVLATLFTGNVASTWTVQQADQFTTAVTTGGLTLTVLAAALVAWGIARSTSQTRPTPPAPQTTTENG